MSNSNAQYIKMTETPVSKLVISLSIPAILTMLVTNIYNLVDTAFVGTLGNSASGAVGVVFGFMSIIQAFGFLFGQGSGSIIARHLGAKDVEQATKTASTAFFASFFCGTMVSIFSFLFLDELIFALGSTETIAPYAKDYIRYILLAAPFMSSSFTLNNILRYEGRAALGMIGMLTGSILNIAGDALFMFVLHLGIAGAGISTALSQIISFSILLSMFLRKKTQTKISWKNASFTLLLLGNICATGLPSLLRQGLNSFATVILNTTSSAYGDEAVAAMSIVSRVFFFVFSVALGTGQGFQPVSGYNYGAGKYRRLRKAFWFAMITSEVFCMIFGAVVLFHPDEILRLFRDDDQVIAIAHRALLLQIASLPTLPICMITEMLFQSTGKRLGAAILSSLRSGVFLIPLLLLLS
nr:MATE family efflux transporter [Lachnospiraceae bacterium]